MEGDKPAPLMCMIVAIDPTEFCYRVCSICETPLPQTNPPSSCNRCSFKNSFNPKPAGSKLLFRVLMSIASDTKVSRVIMFDRAARVLFGCSAQEFFDFSKLNPFAAMTAGTILEGEMLRVILSKPKKGNAEHERVVSIVPMGSNFRPVIETLKELYGARAGP